MFKNYGTNHIKMLQAQNSGCCGILVILLVLPLVLVFSLVVIIMRLFAGAKRPVESGNTATNPFESNQHTSSGHRSAEEDNRDPGNAVIDIETTTPPKGELEDHK